MKKLLLGVLFYCGVSGYVNAAIVYDETLQGDAGAAKITLSSGENIINGTRFYDGVNSPDGDIFRFTLTENMVITGISLSTSNGQGSGRFSWLMDHSIRNDSGGFDTTQLFFIDTFADETINNTFSFLTLPLDMSAGSYSLEGASAGFNSRQSMSLDYSWTISVSPTAVPIPAAAWLFGSALLGLAGMKRKRT